MSKCPSTFEIADHFFVYEAIIARIILYSFRRQIRLPKSWWNGPTWITCKDLWPNPPPNSEIVTTLGCEETGILFRGLNFPLLLNNNTENKFLKARVRIFCCHKILSHAQQFNDSD